MNDDQLNVFYAAQENLHRAERSDVRLVPSLVKNKDYGLNEETGCVITPTPLLSNTEFGLSLFAIDTSIEKHTIPSSRVRPPQCYIVPKDTVLPDGLGVVHDGEVRLKFWVPKRDKKEQRTTARHYSLIATTAMQENEFLTKVRSIFEQPPVVLCTLLAAAEGVDIYPISDTKRFDGPVKIIIEAIQSSISKLQHPHDIFDAIALHTFIDDTSPSFEKLLQYPFYCRIAFHILLLHSFTEESVSSSTRSAMIFEQIGNNFEWDTDFEGVSVYHKH